MTTQGSVHDCNSIPRIALHGPGPAPVPPEVLEAMAQPVLGHLDPAFGRIMTEVSEHLRTVFRTTNAMTFPISGTGSAGMEAAIANTVIPGQPIVIGVNGAFGNRLIDMARRYDATPIPVTAPWGETISDNDIADAVDKSGAPVVAMVHAETSTGIAQPLQNLRKQLGPDPVLVVDAVTSLAGSPLEVDDWGIDVCCSGSQKCLSVPPGLAPITFSARAVAHAAKRSDARTPWYFDIGLIARYWTHDGGARSYHHTAPISMIYGLHEGLRLVLAEGLEPRFRRHEEAGRHLQQGLEQRGFRLLGTKATRLPQITAAATPPQIDGPEVRRRLRKEHALEIGGGLGEDADKILRIGLMGHGATIDAANAVLTAIDSVT